MRIRLQVSWLVMGIVAAFPLAASAAAINHWRFDEVSGLVAADTAGLVANNGVWRDSTSTNLSWGPGMVGNAAVLTGATGIANVFDVGSIEADGLTQLSYSVWIKPALTQQGAGGDLNNKGFFTAATTLDRGFAVENSLFMGATWENQTGFRVDMHAPQRVSGIYTPATTQPQWIHLAFTWDGATEIAPGDFSRTKKVYVNGQLAAQENLFAIKIVDDGNWQIGRDRTFAGRTFAGLIDDLVVWDQTLTPEQVTSIYNSGLQGIDAVEALTPVEGCLGDVDGNCVINDADFQIIRQNFLQPLAARNQGDLIDNNRIDFADYAAWRKAAIAAGSGAAGINWLQVPEPTSMLLFGAAAVLCLGCRQRRGQ